MAGRLLKGEIAKRGKRIKNNNNNNNESERVRVREKEGGER